MARPPGKRKPVSGNWTFIPTGTHKQPTPNPRPPLRSKRSSLGQRLKVQLACVVAADHHGEGVVKAKRRPDAEAELCFVSLLHSLIDILINILLVAARLMLIRLLFENRRERRARIFRINIDSSGEDCLMTDEC